MQAGVAELPQPGPNRVPEVTRTMSHSNLSQPQSAVFEMAGDAPPVPTPQNNLYYQQQQQQ